MVVRKRLQGKKTKIAGYLMVLAALINFLIDLFNGGGVDFNHHYNSVMGALGGSGLIYLRKSIERLEKKVSQLIS